MLSKVKSIYVIDHPRRDLPAYAWWASSLKHEDHCNFLISTSSISIEKINKIKPDIIIWSYARPQNAFLLQYSFLKGIKNIIHDTEGITYRCDKEYSNSCDDLTLRSIHSVWCWGEQQEHLINERCLSIGLRPLALNVGSIRYEYYKTLRFSNNNNQNILINTNFPIINPKYGSLESDYNIWVNIEKKLSKIEYLQRCINLSAMRQSLISFVNNLIDQNLFNPEQIILRTHPFEDCNYYEDLRERGITISTENDIAYDISQSFLMAQCGCQTVLDGLIQGVPSLLIKPHFENIWSDISSHFDIKYLKLLIKDKNEFKKFRDNNIRNARIIVKPFLSNIDKNIDHKRLNSNLLSPLSRKPLDLIRVSINNFFVRYSMTFKNIIKRVIYPKRNYKKKLTNDIIISHLNLNKINYKLDNNNNIYF